MKRFMVLVNVAFYHCMVIPNYGEKESMQFDKLEFFEDERIKTMKDLEEIEASLQKNTVLPKSYPAYSLLVDDSHEYMADSEEWERQRLESQRKIFEMAGARFSPLFEYKRSTTTEDMRGL